MYLTKAGSLVLKKSTLASLPMYMLSIFVASSSIMDELERIIQNFLWGSTTEKKKFYIISWDQFCVDMNWGGLEIRRL